MNNNHRPHVVMQMAVSIDGRIALGPGLTMFDHHPAEEAIPEDAGLWARVEAAIEAAWHPTATMMGSGTVERPGVPLRALPPFAGDPTALHEDYLPEEVVAATRTWAVLVDGRGRCRGGYKATETPGNHILHLVSHAAPPEHLAFLHREQIPYLIGGEAHADLASALHSLYEKLGIRAVRLWGGGTLNGAMLRAGLIDEIHLLVQPVLIGGHRTPSLADCPDLAPDERPAVLELVTATPQPNNFLWLHYRVTRH